MGLDVGDRRIGVAVSDPTRLIARPLAVIDRRMQDALGVLHELVRAHEVDLVVVGLPVHTDGKAGEQAQRVQAFVALLGPMLAVPIRYHDERHSTQTAREIIAAKKRRRRDEHDDAIAASVILQRHLDDLRPLNFDVGPNDFEGNDS
jgi:putative Holliday junction resolvase